MASGGFWDLSGTKEMGKRWGDEGSKAGTPVLPGPGHFGPSLGPGAGFLAPKKSPDLESWVPVLALPLLAKCLASRCSPSFPCVETVTRAELWNSGGH